MSAVDVLRELKGMRDRFVNCAMHSGSDREFANGACESFDEARAAVAELIYCVGDAQSLLSEIDNAVRAEHKKNGAPQSKSVAGIINARLTSALAKCGAAK